MNRTERAVTIVGLIATFCLPWPNSQESGETREITIARAVEPQGTRGSSRAYADLGRDRTGPTAGIQPTR